MLLHIREASGILSDRKKRSAGPYVRTYASQLLNNSLDYNQTRCLFHMFFDSERKKIPSHAHEITFFTSAQERLYISTVVYGEGYLTKLFYNRNNQRGAFQLSQRTPV